MIRCSMCGSPIKPWYEVCFECYNPSSKNATISEPIVAKEFMKNMRIDDWK